MKLKLYFFVKGQLRAKCFSLHTLPITIPKFCTPEKFLELILKFDHDGLSLKQEVHSDVDGVTNSVDPDQADLGLDCLPRPVCPKIQENYIMY